MVYIYLKQNVTLDRDTNVTLRDVAQISAVNASVKQVKDVVLARLETSPLLITAADIAFALQREDVTFMGSSACAVLPRKKQDKTWLRLLKITFVTVLLFIGGGMTVLTYQTDTSMPDAHSALARIFTGDESNTVWIEVPYCIGVGLGVLFFANMIPGRKKEPTIFEIEQYVQESEQIQYQNSLAEDEK